MTNNYSCKEHFRAAIAEFLDARREEKLKGRGTPAENAKYDLTPWLKDAARRVGQIQAATHTAKATHGDSKASSLYCEPSSLPERKEIGSHLLGDDFPLDVTGNAAALDVFKFLKIEVESEGRTKSLLAWLRAKDQDCIAALSDDRQEAQELADAFLGFLEAPSQLLSHSYAKQIFWLKENNGNPRQDHDYIVLQPLFSSILAHKIRDHIQEINWGEKNKEARDARRKEVPHDFINHEYYGMAIRKLGGTKPQNVSQLNSERGGVNMLFASLPPQFSRYGSALPVLRVGSIIEFLARDREIVSILRRVAQFFMTNPKANRRTRAEREYFEDELAQSVLARLATLDEPPGWSRDPGCRLPMEERLWLDPERIEMEEENEDGERFRKDYYALKWRDLLGERFGRQVNAVLAKHGLEKLTRIEVEHWAKNVFKVQICPLTLAAQPLEQRIIGTQGEEA